MVPLDPGLSTKPIAKIPYFTMKHCAHWNGPATLP
ncbi:MAG: hypothetical protein QOJ42_1636, partial [Acidobacteriaceae bacterium]|nr:hypothetical protein [Acidobacteriaceae bacterium]